MLKLEGNLKIESGNVLIFQIFQKLSDTIENVEPAEGRCSLDETS